MGFLFVLLFIIHIQRGDSLGTTTSAVGQNGQIVTASPGSKGGPTAVGSAFTGKREPAFAVGDTQILALLNRWGRTRAESVAREKRTITVNTVSELQTILPLPGLSVFVKGRNAVGDGGGGLFVYSDGAEQTDGGTVFAYNGDLSVPASVARTAANLNGYTVAAGNLAFGSVDFTLSNGIVIPDLLLHGHRLDSGGILTVPRINHKTGLITDLNGWINYTCGVDGVSSITVNYRTIGHPRRWVRPAFDAIMLPWFHGNPSSDTTGAGGNRLAWALVAAKRLGQKTVDLAGNTVRYYNAIEIPDGTTLANGKLKVIDGAGKNNVMKFLHSAYAHGPEFYVGIDVGPGCFHQDGASMIGLRNFEIDGNLAGNEDPLLNPADYPAFGGVHNVLQNTPIWCGLSVSNHSNRLVTNLRIELENVHIHDVGSAGVLGNENAWFVAQNVRLGSSFKNHQFYRADGRWTNLEMYGFCWGGLAKVRHAVIHGLRLLPAANPYLPGTESISLIYFEGIDYGDNAPLPAGTEPDSGILIDGFTCDLGTVAKLKPIFQGVADGVRVANGVITGSKNAAATLFEHLGNGNETGIVTGWSFENILLMQRGWEWALSKTPIYANSLNVRNVEVKNLRGYSNPTVSHPSQMMMKCVAGIRGSGPSIDPGSYSPQNINITNFQRRNMAPTANVPCFEVDVLSPLAGKVKVNVRDSEVAATGPSVLMNKSGSGTAAGLSVNDPTKLEFLWENSIISDNGAGSSWQNFELYMLCSRFKNCTTPNGYKTEESGSVAFTSAGESAYDVATALLWVPKNVTNVILRPKNAVTAAALANVWISFRHRSQAHDITWGSFGATGNDTTDDYRNPKIRINFAAPLGNGQAIAFDWFAAVSP
jgi:hypothetical protein